MTLERVSDFGEVEIHDVELVEREQGGILTQETHDDLLSMDDWQDRYADIDKLGHLLTLIGDLAILRSEFFIDTQVSEDLQSTVELGVLIMRDLIDIDKITVFAISYQDILSCTLDMDIRRTTLESKIKNLIPIADSISDVHLDRESKKL